MNTSSNSNVDVDAVRELELFAENTESIYNSKHMPFVRNYRSKVEKGTFDETLALKGIVNNYVPVVVAEYKRTFGSDVTMDKATKEALGKELLASVMQDVKEGVQ